MSAPFDLSDALKTPPTQLRTRPGSGGTRKPPKNVRLDEFLRRMMWLSLTVGSLALLYQLWGLCSGVWANPTYGHQAHAFRVQQLSNIALTSGVLRLAAVVFIACMLTIFFNEEGVGYVLLGIGAFLFAGVSLLTAQVFKTMGLRPTEASGFALQNLQLLGYFFGIPGIFWSLRDIIYHFKSAAETALLRQTNKKYAEASAARALGVKRVSDRRMTLHQRRQRTYQLLALVVVIGEPLLVYMNIGVVEGWIQGLLNFTNKLSFSTQPAGVAQLHGGDGVLVLWILLISLNLVVISQMLRLLEYMIYRDAI